MRTADEGRRRDVSIVAPVHNEEENLEDLHAELSGVLKSANLDYEVIYVDDGSRDSSLKILKSIADRDDRVIVVELRRNFGQTAAMAAGIEHSCGDVIIPIDADLQNDPNDIPRMLETLNGTPRYDIVSGWRKDRKDKMVTRRIPSQIANKIIARVTNVPIHDFGCTLKAYRREVLEDVSLSSDLHRFLPALAAWHGANIKELVVNHRPRTRGVTKYGLGRTIRVLLDLVIVKFLGTYMTKPLLFFGKIGMWTLAIALVILGVAVGQKFGYFGQPEKLNLNKNILVSLSALLAFLTVQCVMFGLIAELLVRVYQDGRGRQIYRVRQVYTSSGNSAA
ncbi:MAG TPA: glycosyltransferase family 2 protein [Phycisphaerae bacterium]|nr:glycosyltransferase family 2 protein [Phycisphaerae bacterium]HRW55159.1 glycosyltransferase family 2 protein [Phycisphaerae bacterium]